MTISEKGLYSRAAYKDLLVYSVKFINDKNRGLRGYKPIDALELAKYLVDHKPKKLIPTSLYDEINGKGSNAILPKDTCNAMLKHKPDVRCSRKVKKAGDEFCFHHLKVQKEGQTIRTWDEYKKVDKEEYDDDDGVEVEMVYDSD